MADGAQCDRGSRGRIRQRELCGWWRAISRSGDWIFARLWS